MLYVRPVAIEDLDSLVRLSRRAGYGLTTLPPDPDLLRRRIQDSLRGFARVADKPGGETYLLALVDPDEGLVGISGMVAKVGGFEPFYAYQLEQEIHESASLQKHVSIATLHLVKEHNGPSEIGSLFLAPAHRRGTNGRLLSLSRFLFMADHPGYFDATVLAEMRGRIDPQGRSPFWEAVGRHFFAMEFPHADYLVMKDKRFLGELMPRHPIYMPLLPQAAQDAVNQVHPESAPALHLLESEGFARNGMVDIFEGGPVISCARSQIRTVRHSRTVAVTGIHGHTGHDHDHGQSQAHLLSNTRAEGFRACVGYPVRVSEGIEISQEAAAALQVAKGDTVRLAPLRGSDEVFQGAAVKAKSDANSEILS
jgi:arginine N-succinyltransferase